MHALLTYTRLYWLWFGLGLCEVSWCELHTKEHGPAYRRSIYFAGFEVLQGFSD